MNRPALQGLGAECGTMEGRHGPPGGRKQLRHVSQVSKGTPDLRSTADLRSLGIDAPRRRPTMSRGSFGSLDSNLSRPSTAQQMAELGKPKTAAERLLRGYLLERVPDPVPLAEKLAPPVAADFASRARTDRVKRFYGPDGSTCVRRPLTATDHALTKRQLRALDPPSERGAEDDATLGSLDSAAFGLSAYESFMMKRNDLTVTQRQRLHANRRKDEKRTLNGNAIVVHKKMLRKVRAQALEAKELAEKEGRDASAPRPLMALEDRAERISTAIGKMEATLQEAQARDLQRRTKAARKIQRFLRGATVRSSQGDLGLKGRFIVDFFRFHKTDDEESLASYNFKPELYDPLAFCIQKAYRNYRAHAIRVNWICLRLAARWRAKYKLKKRRQRLEALRKARLAANELYKRKNTRFVAEVVREWRRRALDVARAKETWKRGMAILVIKNGLKGWYVARTYKNDVARHLRSAGEPEVQGALVYFLADGDWGRLVESLDKVLRRAGAVPDGTSGFCPFLKSRVVGTRLELADPSLEEYISLKRGDERLLPVAFWTFLLEVDDEVKRCNAGDRVERSEKSSEEQALLLKCFARGLLRDPWDAFVDEGTVVDGLPVDDELWRSPEMSRASVIDARTHFNRTHGLEHERDETPYVSNGSADRLVKRAEARRDLNKVKDIKLTLALREGALRFKNKKGKSRGRRALMASSGEGRAVGAVVAAAGGLFESGVAQDASVLPESDAKRGYKMRWVWDDEICRRCHAIIPDAARARTCRTCESLTNLKADRPNETFKAKIAARLEGALPAIDRSPGKAPPTACGVPLEKPTRVSHVRNEKASTFVVHAMLLELAEAPGLGWRRRGISLAQLWRAAVADARPAIAELAKRKISSVGHLFDVAQRVRGVHNLVSLAHVKVAKRVESMLRHLDDMLRSRAKGDLALERRRRLYANG